MMTKHEIFLTYFISVAIGAIGMDFYYQEEKQVINSMVDLCLNEKTIVVNDLLLVQCTVLNYQKDK